MFNSIHLVGNLSRDVELRYTQGGMGIAKTAIATTHKYTSNGEKKEEVCFIDLTFFARSAEVANQYLRKGSKVLIVGRLVLEQWVDQNGAKRTKHSVTVENMQMLDTRNGQGQQAQDGYQQQQGGYQQPQGQQAQGGYQQQQGGYQQPQRQQAQGGYQQPQGQQRQGQNASYHPNSAQQAPQGQGQRQMPSSSEVPVIDVNDDEPPF